VTTPPLSALGDALERATATELERSPKRRPRRRIVLAVVVAAIAIPAIAIGADQWTTTNEVAASMPAGTLSLEGTEPSCTVVEANVEYHCLLARNPAPEVSDFKGTVEPTVDAAKHVNGGCRSLTSDGREWECYIGQAAVQQQIIGAGFLGQYAPSPGVG
jgi:hypothetical protein